MRAQVDLIFAQQTKGGRTIERERKTVQYALLARSYQDALETGLFFEEPVTVEPH